MQTFFDDSDEYVSADRDPYLRLHRILAGSQKGLDTQMLFDPLEEQFDLPALLVKRCNHLGFESEIVGQKSDPFASVVLDDNTTQTRRVVLACVEEWKHTRLIANNVARRSIDWMRVPALELGIAFCSGDKKGPRRMQAVQPGEVQIAAIHQVICSWLDDQIVENIDLVGLAVGDMNEAGNRAAQVQQREQLDCRLGGPERRPRINRQAQVDGSGIERIYRCIEVHAKRLAGVQRTRHCNQMLRQIGVDLPGARSVCIGQRIAGNRRATKPHVVQPMGLGAQIDFDIAQRFSIGQLRKCHGEELIQTGKILDLVLAPVGCYTSSKGSQWQIRHDLRENEFALMHRSLWRIFAKSSNSAPRRSNRDQIKTSIYANKSLTYKPLM